MPISICKRFEFDAAHHLPEYEGKCYNTHGHRYMLDVEVTRPMVQPIIEEGPKTGMIMDFGDLKVIVNKFIIDRFDHTDLNVSFPDYPTAEIMVHWIAMKLGRHFGHQDIKLLRVRLYETPTAYAEWRCEE